MKKSRTQKCWPLPLLVAILVFDTAFPMATARGGQTREAVPNAIGVRLVAAQQNAQPMVRIILPGHSHNDHTIEVMFPEHVTARKKGATEAEHLYMPSAECGAAPARRASGQSLEYERDLAGGVHFLARATLEDDGVRFHYEFENSSQDAYEMIYAVTDPRMTGMFADVRLERTYVHHANGFDLLASETPGRLTMPLKEWLPARYLVSYTWPVPAQRIEHRDDGITYYNKSRAVDEPVIATLSTEGNWVVASFARTTGNVWSNPELTCQHVDPVASLAPGAKAVTEVKILVFQGSLDDVLKKLHAERARRP